MVKKKYPRERKTSTHVGIRIPNNLYKEIITLKKLLKTSVSGSIISCLENYIKKQ